MTDGELMDRAIGLAMRGSMTCAPNPMVGCVVARDGKVVGEGWHAAAGESHAEVRALKMAGTNARGADMFVNLEPCTHHGRTPPCVDAVLAAGIRRVVVAMEDPDPRVNGRGLERLRGAGVVCETGTRRERALWLNRGFVSRVTRGRPWVRLKTAATMDGRIATAGGSSKWITSAGSRLEVHRMRAASCAVATGSGTATADDPQLTARGVGASRQPLRFLIVGKKPCPTNLRMFEGGAVVVTAQEDVGDLPDDVEVVSLPDSQGKVDIDKLLEMMCGRWMVNHLMVEAGGVLAGALIARGVPDEVVAFMAPAYLGSGKAVADFGAAADMSDCVRYHLRDVGMVGGDVKATLVGDRRWL